MQLRDLLYIMQKDVRVTETIDGDFAATIPGTDIIKGCVPETAVAFATTKKGAIFSLCSKISHERLRSTGFYDGRQQSNEYEVPIVVAGDIE